MNAAFNSTRKIMFVLLTTAMLTSLFKAAGQTKVAVPKYDVPTSEDIKIGKEDYAARESEYVIAKDVELTRYIQTLGDRLVAALPPEYRRPEFTFTFKVVDHPDVNAEALPGGYIIVNRGFLEKTENEGEIAGVLGHEISHVVLRHRMAGITRIKDTQPGMVIDIIRDKTVCAMLGNLCGILATSQGLSNISFRLVYKREDETDSDVLGTHIMFRAGYSTRDMVGMLRTLDRLSGSGASLPWDDSHPDTKARIARVTHEARFFPVSPPNPYQTGKFNQFKARLQMLYPSEETTVRTAPPSKPERPAPSSGNRKSVPSPAAEFREIMAQGFRLIVPANWQAHGEKTIFFAPAGAYTAEHGITHGVMLGFHQAPNAGSPETIVKQYLLGVMSANPHLKVSGTPTTATLVGAATAMKVVMVGTSPITNRPEVASFYVLPLNENILFYVVTIVPQDEQTTYERAFVKVVGSIQPNSN